ncbi:MAG: beta-N-acetylhexosaminidase [Alloprevotella sp.]|nr:beta-N-acetylhexosaminidase [Alloprevotella sp.]
MKKTCLLLLALLPLFLTAQDVVNLTPKPYSMTRPTKGTLTLPASFSISLGGMVDSIRVEAERFAQHFGEEAACNISVTPDAEDALLKVEPMAECGAEEYRLEVKADGIVLKASTATGFFYGFQTICKILNPDGTLPYVTLRDLPRFTYRGFMLDVSRHFFSTTEVKKFIDLMARYKLNRFHWHLTDDQGWRVEIKKYPKLTTIGATAPNCYVTDMKYGPYWTNRQYGPYFYTQDEIRDVVAYAKERHVEIIPEIDMPGHFVAALCAYPEYSCTPNASRSVWTSGGISSDVLNVGNPQAVQFCKDVLDELSDLFPYEQIHIGGDECPTSAWESNAQCQASYKALGLTSYRQLQSHFIQEMSDFLKTKGKKTSVWNEAITASGADTDIMKECGVTVYCWTGPDAAAKKAAQLGLNNIYTPWGPYYINRKQSTLPGEPSAAGDGTDNLRKTYNTVPVPTDINTSLTKYYTGVQGTFWCEHVADTAYLEYLALPRLFAIAEAGWSQQSAKNYDDFVNRVTADTLLLDRLGFNYCRHDLNVTEPETPKVMPKAGEYYRIVTRATDADRQGRCIELLTASSPLVSTYSGKGAAANVIWTNTQAQEGDSNYDYQFWTFEESPTAPGHYALVCKAAPEGSLNPTPTAQSNTGRWKYDAAKKNYNFLLGEAGYGQDGDYYYYTLRSDKLSGWYVNASMPGQGLAANLWTEPLSGNGGLWTFVGTVAAGTTEPVVVKPSLILEEGKTYRIRNSVAGYENLFLADTQEDTYLRWTYDEDSELALWKVVTTELKNDGTQVVRLQNVKSERFIYSNGTKGSGQIGWPVRMAKTRNTITVTYNEATNDFALSLSSRNFYPVMQDGTVLPGIVSSGTTISGADQPARPQGAAWRFEEVVTEGISQYGNTSSLAAANSSLSFDLQGRRFRNSRQVKGVYIVGNKKIVK